MPIKITVLAGGIGGARFLKGVRKIPNSKVTAIVNNGDDISLHGLRICPDLDSVMYNLAGVSNVEQGWGRAEETWTVQRELANYTHEAPWFNIGDKDFATHIYRTELLNQGVLLHEIVKRLCKKWQIDVELIPSTNAFVETFVELAEPYLGKDAIHFQEWWVGHRAKLVAKNFRLIGAESASPAPGVVEAIENADVILLAPSNPVVSIGMILEIPRIRVALSSAKAPIIGTSPIIGGNPVLGMADKCLMALGLTTSAFSVAKLYGARHDGGLLDGWLISDSDEDQIAKISGLGIATKAAPLLMTDDEKTLRMAISALELAGISVSP